MVLVAPAICEPRIRQNGPETLLVFPNVPYPLPSGGHLRDWQVLNILNRMGVRPHVLYFSAGEPYGLAGDSPVHTRAASVAYAGARVERSSMAQTLGRKLQYVLRPTPNTHPFAYQYDFAGAQQIILEHAQKVRAQIVILRSLWCHYVSALKRAGFQVIANCPDYNPTLAREMVRAVHSPVGKLGPLCNYMGVKKLEKRFLPECDEVWVPTEEEAELVARMVPQERFVVMPNLIDVDSQPDLSSKPASQPLLLFVANFSYLPNSNAARLLLTTIFPAIRRQCSEATLVLAGRDLSAELKALAAEQPGVEAPGFVEDLVDTYRQTAVVLLPVLEGAGMLFKALEALAMGRSTVGFRKAFRGIPQNTGAYVMVDSPGEMVREVVNLLRDPARRHAMSKAARKLAETELSWQKGAASLAERSVISRQAANAADVPNERIDRSCLGALV